MRVSARHILIAALCLAGCTPSAKRSATTATLTQARANFKSDLNPPAGQKTPVQPAPLTVFNTIRYQSPAGQLAAYVTPDPGDGQKHPAIIWITGGDCNSIGDVWTPAPAENDQTAAAYRNAGIVMMFPSLRGGNDNPGTKEGFLGEVDDVLAAAKYVEQLPYVDPQRIYLGGHSTGGTLVLLVAESTDRFRAVFSFGPAGDVSGYGDDSGFLPFNTSDEKEVKLRSPGWIIEGDSGTSNIQSLRAMRKVNQNPLAHFVEAPGVSHFSVLKPANEVIAKKIQQDTGGETNLSLTAGELSGRAGQ
jgi:acetyl esterase/lipase